MHKIPGDGDSGAVHGIPSGGKARAVPGPGTVACSVARYSSIRSSMTDETGNTISAGVNFRSAPP